MTFKPTLFTIVAIIFCALIVGCSSKPRIPEKFPDPNVEEKEANPLGQNKQFSYYVDITEHLPKTMAEELCKERVFRRAMRYSKQKDAKLLDDSFEIVSGENESTKVKCMIEATVWR